MKLQETFLNSTFYPQTTFIPNPETKGSAHCIAFLSGFKALTWMREVEYQLIHALTSLQKTISNTYDYFKSIGSSRALVPVCMDEDHQLTSYSY